MQFVNQKIPCKTEEFYVSACVAGTKGGATKEFVNTIMCSCREGRTQKSLKIFFFFFCEAVAFLAVSVKCAVEWTTARLVIPCKKQASNWGKYTYVLQHKTATSLIFMTDCGQWKSKEKGKRERGRKKETYRYIDRERERGKALSNWCWLQTVAPFAMQNLIDWVPYATWQRTQYTTPQDTTPQPSTLKSTTLLAIHAEHPPPNNPGSCSNECFVAKQKYNNNKNENETEKKKRKRARNKIKEMLFHNANCAASITPQLAPVLRPRLVLMSNVKRMRRRRPIVAGDEPQSAIWKCGGK